MTRGEISPGSIRNTCTRVQLNINSHKKLSIISQKMASTIPVTNIVVFFHMQARMLMKANQVKSITSQ